VARNPVFLRQYSGSQKSEVCPMPNAQCPMPNAQCPVVPHLSDKGYRRRLAFYVGKKTGFLSIGA